MGDLEERYAVITLTEERIQELTNRYYRGLGVLQALDKPMTIDELATELDLTIAEIRERVSSLAEIDQDS